MTVYEDSGICESMSNAIKYTPDGGILLSARGKAKWIFGLGCNYEFTIGEIMEFM